MTTNENYGNERAKNLMNAWAQSQVQFWEHWLTGNEPVSTPNVQPEAESEQKDVREQMLDKEVVLRFLEMSQMAWKDLLALAASQQNSASRSTVQTSNSEQFQQKLSIPVATAKTTRDAAELWLMYLRGLQQVSIFSPQAQFGGASRQASLAPAPQESDRQDLNKELTNLYWNMYQNSFGSFLPSVMSGQEPEYNKKMIQEFQTWNSIYKATLEYQLAIADIWTRAFENRMQK